LENVIFDECYRHYKSNFTLGKTWEYLSKEFGFASSEILRNRFKRARKQRGIPSRNQSIEVENKVQTFHSIPTQAKILLFDIETSPIMAMCWGIWQQDINIDAIIQDWTILSWSAKWLFDDEIQSDVLTPYEASEHDDFRIVQSLSNILNQADIVIAHNGIQFDSKRLNTRCLYHGLPPIKHYQSVDTLIIAKNTFSFTSNKLDYINRYLGLPEKENIGFPVWRDAYYGNADALNKLHEYNIRDAAILEDLFLKLRPYIKNCYNLNLWSEDNISICPNCGSNDLTWNGNYFTYTGSYKAFRCLNCGATGRSKQLDLDKEKRKAIVR